MVVGHVVKPIGVLAGALLSPGTLSTVILFTVVAAAELLLNDTIFACPCHPALSVVYGLSFLFVPAIILFLADFPWKLVRTCPTAGVTCSFVRRPVGLAATWLIIGSLQRKYVDCITEEPEVSECEDSTRSSVFQLVGLYCWLLLIVMAFVLVMCRRRKAWCMSGRSTALEMQIMHEMDEALERVNLEKKVKYGTTQLIYEEDVSLESLQAVQPGLNARTYTVLKGEQLLQPTVLRYLRDDDVFSLDVSLAQRCLLRHMIAALAGRPDALSQTTYTT